MMQNRSNRVFERVTGRGFAAFLLFAGVFTSAFSQTIKSVVIQPNSLVGTPASVGISYSGGQVTLSKPAGAGGALITLSTSSSAATPQATVTVPSGKTSAGFRITATPVTKSTPATITAQLGSSAASAIFTVLPPPTLTKLALVTPTVNAWTNATGYLYISWAALDFGVSVNLTSDNPAVTVPASVLVSGSQPYSQFTITTSNVSAKTVATITASMGSKTFSAKLTVLPAVFAGTYVGSYYNTSGSIGPCNFIVGSNGKITGTSTDFSSGSASGEKLSGTITPGGEVTITATSDYVNGPAPTTSTGTASINSNGNLVLALNPTSDSSSLTTVTVNKKGKALEYAGTFTGPIVTSDGGKGGVSLTIYFPTFFCNGGIGTSYFNLSGTVSDTGVGNSGQFYVAYDSKGDLVFFGINLDGTKTSGVLTKYNPFPPQ